MAMISHTRSGMQIYLTSEMKAMLGDRVKYSVHPGSDREFVRIWSDPNGIKIGIQKNAPRYKYRIHIPSSKLNGLSKFGAEVVGSRLVADNVAAIEKPVMNVPMRERKKTRQGLRVEVSLREAVEAVNQHKRKMGNSLVLTVEDGQLRAIVEYK